MRLFVSFSFLWISHTYNRPGLHSFWVISTHLLGTSETTTSRLTMTAAARVKMKLDMVFFLAVTKRRISHRKKGTFGVILIANRSATCNCQPHDHPRLGTGTVRCPAGQSGGRSCPLTPNDGPGRVCTLEFYISL